VIDALNHVIDAIAGPDENCNSNKHASITSQLPSIMQSKLPSIMQLQPCCGCPGQKPPATSAVFHSDHVKTKHFFTCFAYITNGCSLWEVFAPLLHGIT
jgi:hypothetical protein